jgi:transcription initiation factor TFIIIB Brf1 subunit/transcription initiation factor TFIIB
MIWCPECKEDWESVETSSGDMECLKCGAVFCKCCGQVVV